MEDRSDTGVPEKYCAANFLGRGETSEATLNGFARKFIKLRRLFGRSEAISLARRANFIEISTSYEVLFSGGSVDNGLIFQKN